MASRLAYPLFKAFDANADLLVGGKLYSYDPGTLNAKDTWQDAAATVAHTNPIIMDSLGENDIFIDGSTKFVLKDSADVQIWSKDNVEANATGGDNVNTMALLGGKTGTAVGYRVNLLGYTTFGDGGEGDFLWFDSGVPATYVDDNGTIIVPSGGDGSAAWLRSYNESIDPAWFGATGDGVTDDYAAMIASIAAAKLAGKALYLGGDDRHYNITTSPLVFDTVMHIYGFGAQIYQATANVDLFQIGTGANSNGWNVHGLTIGTVAGTGNSITMDSVNNSHFADILSEGSGNAFVYNKSGLLNTFERCYSGDGVVVSPGFFGLATAPAYGFIFDGSGISGNGPNVNTFIGCYVSNATAYGYDLNSGAGNNLYNCDAEACNRGIRLIGQASNIFGGAFENNTLADVQLVSINGGGMHGITSLGASSVTTCNGISVSGSFHALNIVAGSVNTTLDGVNLDAGGSLTDSGTDTKRLNVYDTDTTSDISYFDRLNTFTPSLLFGGASAGLTYNQQVGRSIRNGRVVNFEIWISINAIGASAGAVTISGLPFPSAANGFRYNAELEATLVNTGTGAGRYSISARVDSGASTMSFVQVGSTTIISNTALQNTDMVTGSQLRITGWYEAA